MTESHTQSILTNPAKWSPQCSGLGVQGGERRRLQDELPHDTAHDASTRGSTAPYAAARGFLNPDDQSWGHRVRQLCESGGGRPGPNEPYGFCGRKASLNHADALVTVCP